MNLIYCVIFLSMVFCHIVDDYYLQGWLASAKQKSWWETNAPDRLYRFDYIAALCCHAFSWAFMINLPITIYLLVSKTDLWLFIFISVVLNAIIHGIIDNLKANKRIINLIVDQVLHFYQILITFSFFVVILRGVYL